MSLAFSKFVGGRSLHSPVAARRTLCARSRRWQPFHDNLAVIADLGGFSSRGPGS